MVSVGDITGGGAKMVAAPLSHLKLAETKVAMPGATRPMMANMPAYVFTGLGGGGG